jgi:uncharacterized repeat protein (TIGR02543 family)
MNNLIKRLTITTLTTLFILIMAVSTVLIIYNIKDIYTVKLVIDSNNQQTITFEKGNELKLPKIEKSGYVFEGWFFDANFFEPFNILKTTKKTIIFAKWMQADTFNINVNSIIYGSELIIEPINTSENSIISYLYKVKNTDDSTYSKITPTNAGIYTVKVTCIDNDNIISVAIKEFTINKAIYDMTTINFEDAVYTYDGTAKNIEITGTLPNGVNVSYLNNNQINSGNYTVTAKFTGDNINYEAISDMSATLSIQQSTQAIIDLSNVQTTFTYTGEEQSISGVIASGDVTYINNSFTNAGTYEVTINVSPSENYAGGSKTIIISVNKATYDMTTINFEDKIYTYDRTAKNIEITGTLPNGVNVSYLNNNQINSGNYTVTAKFTGDNINYEAISDMSATLSINTATVTQYIRDGNYIYFGEYPQTIASTEAIASMNTVADSNGYYVSNFDGERYAKIISNVYQNEWNYKFSDENQIINHNTYYFKVEPIKWIVLSENNGTALLLADLIIDNQWYDDNSCNWETSMIRTWLNNTFYNKAFTTLQKEILEIMLVDNSVSSGFYTDTANKNWIIQNDTNDYIFYLSYTDILTYGLSEASTTDYTRANGIRINTISENYGNSYWWLRSPGTNANFIIFMQEDGSIATWGESAQYTYFGTRPTIVINL